MSLARLLAQLRAGQEAALTEALEPELDSRDTGSQGDAVALREEEDLAAGAVLRAQLTPGDGGASPAPGDLAFLHVALLDAAGAPLESTRAEHGGAGRPAACALGAPGGPSGRALRGVELAVQGMTAGERAALQVRPDYAFLHPSAAGRQPPEGQRADAVVSLDVELVRWEKKADVRLCGPGNAIMTRALRPGAGWEAPRPPFEVTLRLTARAPRADAAPGAGELYYDSGGAAVEIADAALESPAGLPPPITLDLGAGALPPGVEVALGEMRRGERALALVPAALAVGGGLVPPPPARDPPLPYVEFTLELVDFLQVSIHY
jgi:FKBP-type peptidyl-prolyl cis-trans isomerase